MTLPTTMRIQILRGPAMKGTTTGRAWRVWLRLDDRWIGPVHVTACAAAHHREMLERRRGAVDLGWNLALWLGVIDAPRAGVQVWSVGPGLLAGRQYH